MAKNKCADCGYLGIKSRTRDTALLSAGRAYRNKGEHTEQREYADPQCFHLVPEIEEEYVAIIQASNGDAGPHVVNTVLQNGSAARRVVNEPRDCQLWFRWHPGFTPKEHTEIQMIEEQREWQAKESAANHKRHRENLWCVLVAAIIGVVGTLLVQRFSVPSQPSQSAATQPQSAATQ